MKYSLENTCINKHVAKLVCSVIERLSCNDDANLVNNVIH